MSEVIQFRELVRENYVETLTSGVHQWLSWWADLWIDFVARPAIAWATTLVTRRITVV